MKLLIEKEYDGQPLRSYLKNKLNISTRLLSRLKSDERGIVLNGQRVSVRKIIRAGDLLCLATEDGFNSDNIVPTETELDILYEDDDIIAIAKPPYMPTHPSHGHFDDTLANGLAFYFEKRGMPFVFRAVSRLDRDTSGIVLAAKNQYAGGRLSAAHKRGDIHKTYIAVLDGIPAEKFGEIKSYIRRVRESIIIRGSFGSGKPSELAITKYEVFDTAGKYAMVYANPITGKTHQLRVHFASIGCPVSGDSFYGKADAEIGRQALHAYRISFPHPTSGETITLECPLPPDIKNFFESKKHEKT